MNKFPIPRHLPLPTEFARCVVSLDDPDLSGVLWLHTYGLGIHEIIALHG